jgi:uracil phosphoribosyltransferase
MPESAAVHLVDHPLVQHKLSLMRDRRTEPSAFRRACRDIGLLMAYRVLGDLPLVRKQIDTPVAPMQAPYLADEIVILAPVLRAGLGLSEGFAELLPAARFAHIGLARDPATLVAQKYYFKAPADLGMHPVLLLDPMLATGHSAIAAADSLRRAGAADLRLVCLLAAPEGIANVHASHPEIPIFTAAIDERLNDHGYIVPGLGDAGDRLFGTT